jgi:quercetin dioxygenase-like cupin family protein
MIIRNIKQEEVLRGLYIAHGGATATMLLESNVLQGLLFFAHAVLKPGRVIESHIDPYEEVYYLLQGHGVMKVGDEEENVSAGDAIWLPYGVPHSLVNDGDEDCVIVVAAAMPRSD